MQPRGRAVHSITILVMALALASASMVACRNDKLVRMPSGDVRVEVAMVGFDQPTDTAYVRLDDRNGSRSLQIAIGTEEARIIALELHGIPSARPLTNELLGQVIARTGNTVDRVEITEVREEVYYAKIILDHGRYAIDSRPSDAIALALRAAAPIYVAATLMQSVRANVTAAPIQDTAINYGVTVQELTPDLALYFGVEAGGGVVIADFGPQTGNAGLRRGDILVEVGGRPIHSPADFAHVASSGGAPITLIVRRRGATHTITIAPVAVSGSAR